MQAGGPDTIWEAVLLTRTGGVFGLSIRPGETGRQDHRHRACLAQCLASCSYCAPLPLPTNFPDLTARSPAPTSVEPLSGAIAAPHLRPPSLS